MGRVYERDNYYLGQKMDRESPGWRTESVPARQKVSVDDKLTAEEVFAVNQKDAQRLGPLYNLSSCKDCIDAGKLSQSEVLRYWGLIRIHEMAALTLYNNRCDNRPSGDKAAMVSIIASQFKKLPTEVQERALNHEVKAIQSVADIQDGAVTIPGGWRWFCEIMEDDINKGYADPMFNTAREGFFPVGMDNPPEKKPITREDCRLPGGIEGLKTTTMDRLKRYEECLEMYGDKQRSELSPTIAKPGELPACDNKQVLKVFGDMVRPADGIFQEIKEMESGGDPSKRWCYAFFIGARGRRGIYMEAVFTLEWQNKSEGRWWLEVRQSGESCRGTRYGPNDNSRCRS
jgi:hypothetical protein